MMGNLSKPELHPFVASWGTTYKGSTIALENCTVAQIKRGFDSDLKQYFRLAALSRSTTGQSDYVESAQRHVFPVRIALEYSIITSLDHANLPLDTKLHTVLSNSYFGSSRKQGTSLRMPLTTCNPTKLCAGACYAHDVLDAAPNAVIRGALNGWLGNTFEKGDKELRKIILRLLTPHVQTAIRNAQGEQTRLSDRFTRRASIRFSHVGEIVYCPDFANALAQMVRDQSDGSVDCVVYTRHRNVLKLDPSLWIINFTLDNSSLDRRAWAPAYARIVFSAFGGLTSPDADVNFLEHHRWIHMHQEGTGIVCPATLPETIDRTCDAVQCNLCFTQKTMNGR
jgi:hypothetical protein